MSLHLSLQTTPGGSYTDVDMAGLGIGKPILSREYNTPAKLTFHCNLPQQSTPLGIGNFVKFWDTDGGYDSSNPTFEGFIDDVSPGKETNIVNVTCYDATKKAAKEIQIMDTAWLNTSPPTEGVGATPRCVFNVSYPNDPDWAVSRGQGLTIGNIMATLFDDATSALRYWNACDNASAPYDSGDLNSFDYVPYDKMVMESEALRQGLDNVIRWEPAVKLLFFPGSRKWRYLNLYNSSTKTITINDFGTPLVPQPYKVLSFELNRSIDNRYTAVEIYGPPTMVQTTWSTADGSLTVIPSGIVLETYSDGSGMHTTQALNTFQITDSTQRRLARTMATPIVIQWLDGMQAQGNNPTLEVSFDHGLSWYAVSWQHVDFNQGKIYLGNAYPSTTIHPPPVAASSQTVFVPTDVRFTASYYAAPLTVRSPSSGFSGTAFSVANIQTVLRIYDEQVAVGYDPYGIPITTAARIAQYQKIADLMLQQRQDVLYAGGVTLEGLVYDFAMLNTRVNIYGKDANHNDVTTGWENIGAHVTSVTYDYDEQTTTLMFSNDQLELMGFDLDFLRHRLQVRPLAMRQVVEVLPIYASRLSTFGKHRNTEVVGEISRVTNVFYDPLNPLGTQQAEIQPNVGANFRKDPVFLSAPTFSQADPWSGDVIATNRAGQSINQFGNVKDQNGNSLDPTGAVLNANGDHAKNNFGQKMNQFGQAINDQGQRVNAFNQPVNPWGNAIDPQTGLSKDNSGKWVDSSGHLTDANGFWVNELGVYIDQNGMTTGGVPTFKI
ncbi:MAG: hypothetical protein KGL39_17085 [Patescibacteria group bacterium]|nr:hypothetical protein [Patescibacteria group bacterium]